MQCLQLSSSFSECPHDGMNVSRATRQNIYAEHFKHCNHTRGAIWSMNVSWVTQSSSLNALPLNKTASSDVVNLFLTFTSVYINVELGTGLA